MATRPDCLELLATRARRRAVEEDLATDNMAVCDQGGWLRMTVIFLVSPVFPQLLLIYLRRHHEGEYSPQDI